MEQDKLYKMLVRCQKSKYKPDLHSFTTRGINRFIYVDIDLDGNIRIMAEEYGTGAREWTRHKTVSGAYKRLIALGAKSNEIED